MTIEEIKSQDAEKKKVPEFKTCTSCEKIKPIFNFRSQRNECKECSKLRRWARKYGTTLEEERTKLEERKEIETLKKEVVIKW